MVIYLAYGSTANFRFRGPIAKIYISKDREGYGVRSGARILEIDQVILNLSRFSQVQSERERTLVIPIHCVTTETKNSQLIGSAPKQPYLPY